MRRQQVGQPVQAHTPIEDLLSDKATGKGNKAECKRNQAMPQLPLHEHTEGRH